jgi:superfamily II DNA/RNA helicase
MSAFSDFQLLDSIIERLALKGYTEPTPIQEACIMPLMDGAFGPSLGTTNVSNLTTAFLTQRLGRTLDVISIE